MIEALLVDLDNTLIDRDAAIRAWLEHSLAGHPHTNADIVALEVADRGGRGPKRGFFERIGCLAATPPHVVRQRFFHELPSFVRARPDAEAWLAAFGGTKVLVTNGPSALQRAKIAASGLARHFDEILVSDECGVRKPDTAIFRLGLAFARCAPERALMVGDDPAADIAGARATGVDAIMLRTRWFDPMPGTRSVETLAEITW